MKKISIVLMALVAILVVSCDLKKDPEKSDVKILPLKEIPGVYEAHGVIGENTSMNVLEFLNDDGDTLYINISNASIMGGCIVGNEVQLVYNVTENANIGTVAINLTSLQHLWGQKGADGQEQSLELNSNGRAATYDMSIDYNSWEVRDGLLLLHSPKKLGDESPAIVDTFQIMELSEDNLVLMNGNLATEFERIN